MLDQDQYWLGHLKAIDASGTTTKAYGKLHRLNVQKLYEWRKKFKMRQASGQWVGAQGWVDDSPFVAVQVKTESSMVAMAPVEVARGCVVAVQVKTESSMVAMAPVEVARGCVVRCGALRLELGELPPVSWVVSLAQATRGVD